MQARSHPWCRFVIADPIHPMDDLDLLRRAPPSNEYTRDRHIGEIDGLRVIHDASRA
jgi:hypothetical protein